MPIIDEIKEFLSGEYVSTAIGVIAGSAIIGGDLVGEAVKSATGQRDWYGVGVEGGVKIPAALLAFIGGRRMPIGLGKNLLYGISIGNTVSWGNDLIGEAFRKPAAVSAMSVPGVIGSRLGTSIRAMVLGSHAPRMNYSSEQLMRSMNPQYGEKPEAKQFVTGAYGEK